MQCQDFSHSRPHQDISLWPDRPNHINCWLPLCDIDDELAPLLIVPESSKKIFPHVENKYGQMEVASFDKQMLTSKKICARFGDLVMFSPKIIHFSAPNLTKTVRWSLDFRYQTSASGWVKASFELPYPLYPPNMQGMLSHIWRGEAFIESLTMSLAWPSTFRSNFWCLRRTAKTEAIVVRRGRYFIFRLVEGAAPKRLFLQVLKFINNLRPRPIPV